MVVINKKKLLFFVLVFFFIINTAQSSIILDYQTEEFIKKINNLVFSVNDYQDQIEYKVILDDSINAYVNENKEIYISSGLIENSSSYVALLGVVAHEIGHLEKYHLTKRKESLKSLSTINALGTLSVIAGSILSNNTDIIQALAVNKVSINNFYINFTKEQEKEADHYAVETINNLDLPKEPLIKLLNKLEEESLNKGITEEYHKFSTHPIYKKRFDIINKTEENLNTKINTELENEFNFIKAKFIGYSIKNEKEIDTNFSTIFANYARSIYYARSGKLKDSLKILNKLILNNKNNFFLLETKADILMSYGYKNEAIKFYNKVLEKFPDNNYVKLILFNNINQNSINISNKEDFFNSNINLLYEFPNYKILYINYKNLCENLGKKDWISFFEVYESKENIKKDKYFDELSKLKNKTSDKVLNKLIKMHMSF